VEEATVALAAKVKRIMSSAQRREPLDLSARALHEPAHDLRHGKDLVNRADALPRRHARARGINGVNAEGEHPLASALEELERKGPDLAAALLLVLDVGVAQDAHGLAGVAARHDGVGTPRLDEALLEAGGHVRLVGRDKARPDPRVLRAEGERRGESAAVDDRARAPR